MRKYNSLVARVTDLLNIFYHDVPLPLPCHRVSSSKAGPTTIPKMTRRAETRDLRGPIVDGNSGDQKWHAAR